MAEGWIKYHRSIEDWEWYDDAYTLKLFLYIISNANIQDKRWKGIEIKRGQLITSLDKLSEKTNMTKKRVYKRLNDLVSSGEVTKEGTSFTLITVCKYGDYQENGKLKETEKEQKGNTKETERETTKERKERKEVNKGKFTIEEVKKRFNEVGFPNEAEKFFNYFESCGWLVGNKKAPMKSLNGAIGTWCSRLSGNGTNKKATIII